MKAKFIGPKRSMGYKPDREYILATTYHKGKIWAVDINGKGKPTPYRNFERFLNNWEIIDLSNKQAENELKKR